MILIRILRIGYRLRSHLHVLGYFLLRGSLRLVVQFEEVLMRLLTQHYWQSFFLFNCVLYAVLVLLNRLPLPEQTQSLTHHPLIFVPLTTATHPHVTTQRVFLMSDAAAVALLLPTHHLNVARDM